MSVTAPDTRITTYNPVVATTTFAALFPVFDNSDLAVVHNGVERTDFTVTATYSAGISDNARVVFADGIIGSVIVVGARDPRRTNRFANGRPLRIQDVNMALDTIEAEIQEAQRDAVRAHKAPFGEEGAVLSVEKILSVAENAAAAEDAKNVALEAKDAAVAAASGVNIRLVAEKNSLKALNTSIAKLAYARELGRGGLFAWTEEDFTDRLEKEPTEIIYVRSLSAPPIMGAWARKGDIETLGVNPEMAGARYDNADSSAPLQEIFDACDKLLLPIAIPNKAFQFSQTLTKQRLTSIRGTGKTLSSLVYTGLGDAIQIRPTNDFIDRRAFWRLSDFGVLSTRMYTAQSGIRLIVDEGQYISNFIIENLYLGTFGVDIDAGGISIDNSSGNGDRIFKGIITQCWINSGIRIRNGGDSLSIVENTITGEGIGVYATLISGARQLVIRNNNMTPRGIICYLSNVDCALLEGNWMESPWYQGDFQGVGSDDALVYLEDCNDTLILKNTIHPLHGLPGFVAAPYTLSDLTSGGGRGNATILDYNQIGNARTADLRVTSKNLKIGPSNNFITGSRDFTVSPASARVVGIPNTPSLLNGWLAGGCGAPRYRKGLDNIVQLNGSVTGGAGSIFVLPVGFRPSSALRLPATQAASNAVIEIGANGTVNVAGAGGNTEVSLSGICFPAPDA